MKISFILFASLMLHAASVSAQSKFVERSTDVLCLAPSATGLIKAIAEKEKITPEDLKGVPIITSAQSKEQDVFRVWAGSLIDQYNFIGQYNLIFNARLLAETGACLALTYKNLINITGTGLVFRPLTPTVTDQNNLIWNKNRQLSNVAQFFLNRLKEGQ